MILCALAALSLLTGAGLTIHALSNVAPSARLIEKRQRDAGALAELKKTFLRNRAILDHYGSYPATPPRFEAVVRSALPSVTPIIRSTDTRPAVPGWTAKTVKIGFTDITGADLARLMTVAAAEKPPWTALEGTLTASPAAGRLAKVELVMETVERQDSGN